MSERRQPDDVWWTDPDGNEHKASPEEADCVRRIVKAMETFRVLHGRNIRLAWP